MSNTQLQIFTVLEIFHKFKLEAWNFQVLTTFKWSSIDQWQYFYWPGCFTSNFRNKLNLHVTITQPNGLCLKPSGFKALITAAILNCKHCVKTAYTTKLKKKHWISRTFMNEYQSIHSYKGKVVNWGVALGQWGHATKSFKRKRKMGIA